MGRISAVPGTILSGLATPNFNMIVFLNEWEVSVLTKFSIWLFN